MGLEQRGRWRWSLPVVDGLMGREELGVTRLEVSCGCGHAGTNFLGPRLSARHAGDDGEETVERLAARAAPDSRGHQKAEVPQPDFAPAGISREGKGGDDPWSPIVRCFVMDLGSFLCSWILDPIFLTMFSSMQKFQARWSTYSPVHRHSFIYEWRSFLAPGCKDLFTLILCPEPNLNKSQVESMNNHEENVGGVSEQSGRGRTESKDRRTWPRSDKGSRADT